MSEPSGQILWSSGQKLDEAEHIVFLGIFDADRFREKIESWLPNLDLSGTHLLISDNHSQDNSISWLTVLAKTLKSPLTIIQNPKNYGGYGNLSLSLRLIPKAKWVTTLHQDDYYRRDHIQQHVKVLNQHSSNLGMICTEAKSFLPTGKLVRYPRANWLLGEESDPVTVFLANLKNHAYPFSGATFLREMLERYPVPWHSTSFPDTEIVMKMCIDYQVAFASELTVEYLENPESESHSLGQGHRDFGAYQALIRVFAHPNYGRLCGQVSEDKLENFIEALIAGIETRIQDPHLCLLLKQNALEITAYHTGTFPKLASELAEGYALVGDYRAVDLLNALGAGKTDTQKIITPANEIGNRVTESQKWKTHPAILATLRLVPRTMLRPLFRLFMKSRLAKKNFSAWDFDWKR